MEQNQQHHGLVMIREHRVDDKEGLPLRQRMDMDDEQGMLPDELAGPWITGDGVWI